jgi:hypothetical protein
MNPILSKKKTHYIYETHLSQNRSAAGSSSNVHDPESFRGQTSNPTLPA